MSKYVNKTAIRNYVKTELGIRASESMFDQIDLAIVSILIKAKHRAIKAHMQTIKDRHI